MMYVFFFFNDTATTEIYTLSLHDALPIYVLTDSLCAFCPQGAGARVYTASSPLGPYVYRNNINRRIRYPVTSVNDGDRQRSEEHTSELQSRQYLVCRLLLEKKKKTTKRNN